jgi:anthranilate phosphoribosyltransferase
VCGYGSLDELTTTGPNHVSHLRNGEVRTYDLDPATLGFRGANIAELLGGDPPANAAILRGVLSGGIQDGKRDIVLLNAAAALLAAERVADLESGIALARTVIDDGAALAKLNSLIAFTQRMAT